MSLSASNSEHSSSFHLLDKRIQRWIWDNQWAELRDIQEYSIPLILKGEKDVVLAAATASGKTEAAFLPILTRMLQMPEMGCVLYISPLKALINDQFGRLEQLCEKLEIPITPWHGDAVQSKKQKFLKVPVGVLLITPESLEAMLMLRGHNIPNIFKHLRYIVIDELHAFIGTERGKQLQSLMHRIDIVLKHTTPRIALSATLGDMPKAAAFLRPNSSNLAEIIESKSDIRDLRLLIKGYTKNFEDEVIEDLFKKFRGSSNLVFPNSRQKVEIFADALREKSEKAGVENEFFPHHGSLSKTIREEMEAALKSEKPITAICTTTLELGIDIGNIKQVAQIGCAPSVASLRQRLGRSGRRQDESAILLGYADENEIKQDSNVSTRLRIELIQLIAQIRLLISKWYEPPRVQNFHASTLIQQLLAIIAQYSGVSASDAWKILHEGAFSHFSKQDFIDLLRHLGDEDIIIQTERGLLLHGTVGEKIVNDYKFYAAFQELEEYRIVHDHKTLGTLPINYYVESGDCIVFAGKRWMVHHVENSNNQIKRIDVVPDRTGKPPKFSGEGFSVDDHVCQEMYRILAETNNISFLDRRASALLEEARSEFLLMKLADKPQTILGFNDEVIIFTWRGNRVTKTFCLLLEMHGIKTRFDFVITAKVSISDLLNVLKRILALPAPVGKDLVAAIPPNGKTTEKWDHLLPEQLLSKNYASAALDVKETIQTIKELVDLYA